MDSYLIRIYRRCNEDPEGIVGIVEDIDSGLSHSFKGLSDLCRVLTFGKFSDGERPAGGTSEGEKDPQTV